MADAPTESEVEPMLYLMNSPVMTGYGSFSFEPVATIEAARALLEGGFESAIGHQGAADLMAADLGVDVPVVRRRVVLQPGDRALCLRLTERLREGEILNRDALHSLPHEYGLITRIS